MTVEELIALEEIRQLKHRYCDLCDTAQLAQVAALFTEDARCDLGPTFGTSPMEGRSAIEAGFAAFADLARPHGTLHRVTNPVVRLAGNDAEGTWYLHEVLLADPTRTDPTLAIGVYRDTYRRVEGSWLIASSRLDVLWPRAA